MVKPGKSIKRIVAGQDWGYTNPGVLQAWGLDGDDRLYLIYEVYQTGRQIDWWISQAQEVDRFYKPEWFTCDPSEPAFIDAYRQAGLTAFEAYNPVLPGIQAVQMRLRKHSDGRPRLYVSEDACPERDVRLREAKKPTCTAEEFASYVWLPPVNGRAPKEEPMKKDDHGMDTCRYVVAELDGLGHYSAGAWA